MISAITPLLPRIDNLPDDRERTVIAGSPGHPHAAAHTHGTAQTRAQTDAAPGTAPETVQGLSTPAATAGQPEKKATKLEHAAQEFESLLLTQLLKAARDAGSGDWLGSGKSQAGNPALELAETQLARVMAQSGALGLTRLLVSGLSASPAGDGPSHKTGTSQGPAVGSPTASAVRRQDGSHE